MPQFRDVPRKIRQNIFDGFTIENIYWGGQLDDVEFLERIFDLKNLPSTDSRYPDAVSDIWQHRINNDDWRDGWILPIRLLPTPTKCGMHPFPGVQPVEGRRGCAARNSE
jgi:hypothetical protein